MSISIELQNTLSAPDLPDHNAFQCWVDAITCQSEQEVLIRIVDHQEMLTLNHQFRQQEKATNVLSFRAELPAVVDIPLLGDVVICAPVVLQEAQAQGKTVLSHWAHMTVHGILHLQGYDHTEASAANIMEQLETDIMRTLGFANPYTDTHSHS